jgi:DNA-binding beta-propeller fold protein YncE
MTQPYRMQLATLVLGGLLLSGTAFAAEPAQTAEQWFAKGQAAYSQNKPWDAIQAFQMAVKADDHYTDAYYNLGVLYSSVKKYPESQKAFNRALELRPQDQASRFELARLLEKAGRPQDAIVHYEVIPPNSSRYAKAQENILRLKQEMAAKPPANASPAAKPVAANPTTPPAKLKPIEYVTGLAGPTGMALDAQGNLIVANFSNNNIFKVSPSGEKKVLASGTGLNGPVGLALDPLTGYIYVANHLDNSVARVTQDGKVSVIATGLKKPYNLFLDRGKKLLYVSQQESNSVARITLP